MSEDAELTEAEVPETTEPEANQNAEGEAAAPETTPEGEKPQEEPLPSPPPQKFKVKVDDNEQEVTLEELLEGFELSKASRKRFQEAAEYHRAAQFGFQKLTEEPVETLIQILAGKLGDRNVAEEKVEELIRPWMVKRVEEKLAEAEMSEAEKSAKRAEREYRTKLEAIERERRKYEQIEAEKAQAAALAEADKQITAALEKSGLPSNADVADRILRTMLRHIDAGQDITPEQAAEKVKAQMEEDFAKAVSRLTPEELYKRDPAYFEKVGKFQLGLARARSSNPSAAARANGTTPGASNQSARRDGASHKKAGLEWDKVFGNNF